MTQEELAEKFMIFSYYIAYRPISRGGSRILQRGGGFNLNLNVQ